MSQKNIRFRLRTYIKAGTKRHTDSQSIFNGYDEMPDDDILEDNITRMLSCVDKKWKAKNKMNQSERKAGLAARCLWLVKYRCQRAYTMILQEHIMVQSDRGRKDRERGTLSELQVCDQGEMAVGWFLFYTRLASRLKGGGEQRRKISW